jgi:D-glycero-D-manno-heptose 1,7-bisphosphate phosphatase
MSFAPPSPHRFVLLDRDGTVNVECDYLSRPDQLALYPGVGGALRQLRDLGCGLVLLTNQSGVARGYFDLATVNRVHDRLRELLRAEGVALDGIYLCPHGPDDDCACRKPRTGMVDQAVAELGFDPRQAFMVGDKAVDIDLGHAVGATPILVRTGWGAKAEREAKCTPAVIVDDLAAAAAWISQSIENDRAIEKNRAGETRPS